MPDTGTLIITRIPVDLPHSRTVCRDVPDGGRRRRGRGLQCGWMAGSRAPRLLVAACPRYGCACNDSRGT